MKKIIYIPILLLSVILNAQDKVSFKKKNFFVPSILYSTYTVLDNVITQTTFYQLDPDLKNQEQILKKKFFEINGYIKDPINGKLRIYISIARPKFIKSQIDSIFDKEERQWKYQLYTGYQVKINVTAKYADKILFSELYDNYENAKLDEDFQRKNIKQISDANNRRILNAELKNETEEELGLEKVIDNAMLKIQNRLINVLGYAATTTKEKFEFMTSKVHPEYQKMLDFENEITTQLENITLEKGLDKKKLLPHLVYLESLLNKYPVGKPNTDIRFIITNNLATTYFLLEENEKALLFSNLLIENKKQESRGQDIITCTNAANFKPEKTRMHSNRFADLKKLGFKILEEKEDARLAFFERIDLQDADWEQEKANRIVNLEKKNLKKNNILDSIVYQSNPKILAKIVENWGGIQAIKSIEKVHILSKLKIEDSNVTQTEEKWATSNNFLIKRKTPEIHYQIINGPEFWNYDSQNNLAQKWKLMPATDYWNKAANLDLLYLLNDVSLDLWNNYELLPDMVVDGVLCYHLQFFEKKLNENNRLIPKLDSHLFIDKKNFNIIATEKTTYQDGNKSSFEKRIYQGYQQISILNNAKIPFIIHYNIEDYYGETFYTEQRDTIEINPTFSNRIFIKEIYAGGFK